MPKFLPEIFLSNAPLASRVSRMVKTGLPPAAKRRPAGPGLARCSALNSNPAREPRRWLALRLTSFVLGRT